MSGFIYKVQTIYLLSLPYEPFKNNFTFALFAEHFQNGMLMKINQSIF